MAKTLNLDLPRPFVSLFLFKNLVTWINNFHLLLIIPFFTYTLSTIIFHIDNHFGPREIWIGLQPIRNPKNIQWNAKFTAHQVRLILTNEKPPPREASWVSFLLLPRARKYLTTLLKCNLKGLLVYDKKDTHLSHPLNQFFVVNCSYATLAPHEIGCQTPIKVA